MQQPESLNNGDQTHIDRSIKKLLRNTRSILGQMASHNILETANWVTAVANDAELESRESPWDGVFAVVFRRATRDTVNPSEATKLCAQLCHHLIHTSGDQGPSSFSKGSWLGQKIFWLCINSLPPSNSSEVLLRNSVPVIPDGGQLSQGSARSDGASSEYPPAERTTFFVADLYGEAVLTAPQMHEYVERLINSGTSKEECATGLCALIEQHGQTLDSGRWKNGMDSAFRWIDMAATEYLAGKRVETRIKAIIRLRSQGWEPGQIFERRGTCSGPGPASRPLVLMPARGDRTAGFPSALTSARVIEDLNAVNYPEAIKTPNPDLSFAVEPGRFRYDRDFLLQFRNVCKERPVSLAPLGVLGLDPDNPIATPSHPGGKRVAGRRVGSTSDTLGLARQNSIGLGLGNVSPAKGGSPMSNFQAPPSHLGDSQSRFEASTAGARRTGGTLFPPGASGPLIPVTRSSVQGGAGGSGGPFGASRTGGQRGNNRSDSMRGSGFQMPVNQMASFELVTPLEQSETCWVPGSMRRTPRQVDACSLVERKVKLLLNKLVVDNFDSISDQIIRYVNLFEHEKDGATLVVVIKLVFESAKNGVASSKMYARLCRKMVEFMSPGVQDETIRGADGKLITGGALFRKYLLNLCKKDFERGWSVKDTVTTVPARKSGDDRAAEATGHANGATIVRYNEYYTAAKARRQGIGLVRFIGELFRLQMLTERIMHECIKKLLTNVTDPEEEKVESLCELLVIVGQSLDNAKARNHMDIYFERMHKIARGRSFSFRIQFMLQDVIELRGRHWQARAQSAPSAGAGQHSSGRAGDESYNSSQRGGPRLGEHRENDGPLVDECNVTASRVAARPPTKAEEEATDGARVEARVTTTTETKDKPASTSKPKRPVNVHALFQGNSGTKLSPAPAVAMSGPAGPCGASSAFLDHQPQFSRMQLHHHHPHYQHQHHVQPQWGPQGHYYSPQAYDYHPHPRTLAPISTTVFTPSGPYYPAAQLNSARARFVPSTIRPTADVRITTPDGSPLSFKGAVPPLHKVTLWKEKGPPPRAAAAGASEAGAGGREGE